jgi:hypothetical protein
MKAQTLEKVLKYAHIPYNLACHLQIDADPVPDPAYHFDADPHSDPDPQHCLEPDPGIKPGSKTLVYVANGTL